ncbi:putative mitochondrial import receptor subunit [Aspergillus heteromorphus CBS 117.55]|uniref:Putative mitochondrial import receptor subunit n=1 Tax=Aspergillus heteromorphus CBS 117.55 TaxID=1448321 RepID=A0A317WYY8_9EURO|nr:putative mitochondrial import receptor subunit [Aspergillus heteromorphus CBS 117.55]PWY91181.1 putative mitochondrial import receptor subunit [Aspergillus heteromorphus CBS 117.55]
MVLELHVWGPALSLPSIDAQCLATIAYLSVTLPKDAWVLVASSDPSVSPTNELPALKNGSTWVSRFRNIADYLRQYSNGEWDLDQNLSGLGKADNIAFTSFLESRAQSLLDLSLYVTSQNYYGSTSPSYGAILQWPQQWILPPQLHSAAKSRTEHLGLSSLDLAAIEEQRQRDHSAAVAAGHVPKNLVPRPRDTVSGLLGKTTQQNQFRLEALTGELFDALEEILAGKDFFLHTRDQGGPTSLDCLALGYLSLALVPELPNSWLRDAMKSKAPGVTGYTERWVKDIFGVVELQHAFSPDAASGSVSILPWRVPERARLVTVGNTLFNALADATPIWKDIRLNNRVKEVVEADDSGLSGVERTSYSALMKGQNKDVWLSVGAAVGAVATLVGYVTYAGMFSSKEEQYEEEAGDQTQEENHGPGLPEQPLQAADFLKGF